MADLDAIVKANDIRGLVPDQWSTKEAAAFGAAFADVIVAPDHGKAAVIGHDMRPSSAPLATAFAEGVAWRGINVKLIGQCSTDELYFASGANDLAGAMFTASHNPAEYNGIKFCRTAARAVGRESGLDQVKQLAQQYLDEGIPAAADSGTVEDLDVHSSYASYLRSLVPLEDMRRLKVAVDAGNGMGGLTVPAVLGDAAGLAALNIELVPLFFELDGSFPNHVANPLEPENLVDLETAVVASEADIGLAFDGDADRCFVIDEKGVPVSPSAITALIGLEQVKNQLKEGNTPTIIHNHITSRHVPEIIEAAGGIAVETKVGHSFIKPQMAEHGAIFGGEHSGHFYFKDFWFADTGMLAALHVLRALATSHATMSQLAEFHSPYYASGEINSKVADIPAALARVREAFSDDIEAGIVKVEEVDGVTFRHWQATPRWWVNLRPSNTEPLLRMNVEAEDEDILEKMTKGVLSLVREGSDVAGGQDGGRGIGGENSRGDGGESSRGDGDENDTGSGENNGARGGDPA